MLVNVLIRKARTLTNRPELVLRNLLFRISPLLSDRVYLKILFPILVGYRLNLDNPKTYNEKLQWLKINYRRPEMIRMVDKFEAKNFAREIIGPDYVVENLGVWDSFDEIDFDSLPDKFVLKTTHDQGGVIIVKDKSEFDRGSARKKLNSHLKTKHFYLTREWPYREVKPRIIAEPLLESEQVGDLWDYKFYCFHGQPTFMYIAHGRQSKNCFFDFYDMNFNKLDISRKGYPRSNSTLDFPKNWELMKELATKLSEGLVHVRVDFYNINGKIYLGELTFFQGGGMMPFYPEFWDEIFGEYINLELAKVD